MALSLRRRVAREIFFAPGVLLPIGGGIAACLASLAAGGIPTLTYLGLAGIAVGFTWLAARLNLGVEKIVQKLIAQDQADALRHQETRLAGILKKLRYDRDPRTDEYFTLLKTARDEFNRLAEEPKVVVQSLELQPKVNTLFWSAIDQLENSHAAYELAEKLYGEERDAVLARREAMLSEVKTTLEQLQRSVEQLREITGSASESDLEALRDELDESLSIAARTEQRMRDIEREVRRDDFLKE